METDNEPELTPELFDCLLETSASGWHCYEIMHATELQLYVGPALSTPQTPGQAVLILKPEVLAKLAPVNLAGNVPKQVAERLTDLSEHLARMATVILEKVPSQQLDLTKPQAYIGRDVATGEIIESNLLLSNVTPRLLAYEYICNATTETSPEPLANHPELMECYRELQEIVDGWRFEVNADDNKGNEL